MTRPVACTRCLGALLAQEYKEAARLQSSETGITLIPNDSNIFSWRALLKVRCWRRRLRRTCAEMLVASRCGVPSEHHPSDTTCWTRSSWWVAGRAQGPSDTPFEGGTFELVLSVPEQYPLVPPAVRFKTQVFHPNVHFKVWGTQQMGVAGSAS